MKVFEPGTKVLLGYDKDIPAEISMVKWLLYGVLYEVTWWEDNSVHTGHFAECEFTTNEKKKDFGFGNGK